MSELDPSTDSDDVGDFAPGPAVAYLYLSSGAVEAWKLDPRLRSLLLSSLTRVRDLTGDAIEVRALSDGQLLYRVDA